MENVVPLCSGHDHAEVYHLAQDLFYAARGQLSPSIADEILVPVAIKKAKNPKVNKMGQCPFFLLGRCSCWWQSSSLWAGRGHGTWSWAATGPSLFRDELTFLISINFTFCYLILVRYLSMLFMFWATWCEVALIWVIFLFVLLCSKWDLYLVPPWTF